MQSIVPLIFLLFLMPGTVYGYAAGTFKESKDVIDAMTKAMQQMSYYIVMAFFCALFIAAFGTSNLGALLAVKGANFLRELALPAGFTIVGIVFLTGFVNLAVGSASAKWALLAPIFVPMLMQLGISAELTQAAYRVGDSTTNIITPAHAVLPARRGLLPALREVARDRYARLDHAAVFDVLHRDSGRPSCSCTGASGSRWASRRRTRIRGEDGPGIENRPPHRVAGAAPDGLTPSRHD